MDPATVTTTTFRVTMRRDHLGADVSSAVAGTIAAVDGATYDFTPTGGLQENSLYEVRVATDAKDPQGNPLAVAVSDRFLTVMDRAVENVFVDETSGARADLPAGSLAADGYMTGTSAPSSSDQATAKLATNASDPLRRPLATVDLKAYDAGGSGQSAALGRTMTVSLPFTDAGRDGIVDGTSPPVRVRTLRVYWLDEAHNVWAPLDSTVDAASGRVTASAPRLAVFALMAQGDLDLSGAYPFPVPFTPGKAAVVCGSATGDGVCFTGLPQGGVIRLYTPDGRKVRELSITDGLGQLLWDVKNSSGENVATGIYLYEISNGRSSMTGKLAVLR